MYPKVYEDYKKFTTKYGDLSVLPTRYFLSRPEIGEEFHVELEKGKVLILKLLAIGPLSEQTGLREVLYEMNGETRTVTVEDQHAAIENVSRPKADPTDSSQVGAPMSGVLVEVRVHDGSEVKKGDPVAILSAMKMVCILQICNSYKQNANKHNRKWSSLHLTPERLTTCLSARATRSTLAILSASSSSELEIRKSVFDEMVSPIPARSGHLVMNFLAQRLSIYILSVMNDVYYYKCCST